MRDEAEAAVARQQEAAEGARRRASTNTRQDLQAARDGFGHNTPSPRVVFQSQSTYPWHRVSDDINGRQRVMAEDDELPLTALAEQARAQLRQLASTSTHSGRAARSSRRAARLARRHVAGTAGGRHSSGWWLAWVAAGRRLAAG